jgi:hypothetical protein
MPMKVHTDPRCDTADSGRVKALFECVHDALSQNMNMEDIQIDFFRLLGDVVQEAFETGIQFGK